MVLAITTIALAGCAGDEKLQDFGSVEAPDIKAGYAYAYEISGNVEFEATGAVNGEPMEPEGDSVTIPAMPLFVMQVLNTSFGPNGSYYLGAAQYADAPAGALFGDVETSLFGKAPIAIRKTDLAPFEVSTSQSQQCSPGCRLTTTSMEVSGETVLDPYLDFPLHAGKSWTNQIPLGFGFEDEGMYLVVDSMVKGKKTVDVANASVDAILIQHTMRVPNSAGLFADAIAAMEAEGAQDVTFDMQIDGRVDSYYAEAFSNVVREVSRLTLSLDVGFTMEGHRIDGHIESAVDLTVQLTGAVLEADPERDTAGIYAFFDGAEPVKRPGDADPDSMYTIRVSADKAEFNVAEDPTVTFTVTADPALPAGDSIRFTASDASGKLVDSGLGSTFEVDFADPGLYQVVVQAVSPAGVVQAVDAMVVAADLEDTVELTCGTVVLSAVPNSNTCTTAAIPLETATGLQGVSITINADNPLALGGTFRITDAAGTVVEKEADDGEGFTLADLSTLTIGPDGWTASWHRDAAVLEEASVTIKLDYGPETTPASEEVPPPVVLALKGQLARMQQVLPTLL